MLEMSNYLRDKLLIVEDSGLIVDKLKDILTPLKSKYEVHSVGEENKAVEYLITSKPSYMILDITLDEGDGLGVLRRINKTEFMPYTIVLSNLSDNVYRNKCLELGAKHFLDKSKDFEKIFDILSDAVN